MFKAEDEDRDENGDPFGDHEERPSLPHVSINTVPLSAPAPGLSFAKQKQQRFVSSPSRRSADFLNFTRPVSFSTTYSKVHPGTTGAVVLEKMERLDAVKASLRKLGGGVSGDCSGNSDRERAVAGSTTSPRTKDSRPSAPISASGRIPRSSSSQTHTCNNDNRVPPVMTASSSGSFSLGGVSDGLPATVEEAPSSNASEVDGEDLAQMSKSKSHIWMPGRRPIRGG